MKKGLLVFTCFFITILILSLRPLTITPENCEQISGIVTEITIGPSNDIILKLSNDPSAYYINRGLERGLTIDGLNRLFLQKNASISFAKHWTPLDITGNLKHITELKTSYSTVFSELK